MTKERKSFRWRLTNFSAQFLLLALVASCGAVFAEETAVGTEKTKAPLQGAVNHDETVPSVPEQYQVGKQFDETQLEDQAPNNIWFPIPPWLGGNWHSDTKTVDYVQDCKTGVSIAPHHIVKQVGDAIHGHQRDKTGQIWEFIDLTRVRKIGVDKGTAYLRVLREEPIETDASQVVLKVLTNQITVDGKKHEIVESNQVQQIGSYTPLEDGLVQLSASLKNFDAEGAPIQMQRTAMVMNRTKPYADTDTLEGQDLKKLFIEYLLKTGHQDLMPK